MTEMARPSVHDNCVDKAVTETLDWATTKSKISTFLCKDSEGNATRNGRLPGIGQTRYYHFSDKVLQG